ncbi:MAG: response regulator transcription factor [Bacteroidetes bacterium]|nr:response regulator transcription factor [Bacteroidota bacterium]
MNNHTRILLVEDDLNFGAVLKSYLELNDFELIWVSDGAKAGEVFGQDKFNLVLLDVMLPNIDGFSIAREIRASEKQVPIIFITAKTLREDIVMGYKTGADDYITKPFDSEILLYKIKAVLNRHNHNGFKEKDTTELGLFIFDFRSRSLTNTKLGKKQSLTPKESELLKMLLEKEGELLLKVDALNKIWGDANYFTTRSMDVYITKLRKHLSADPTIQIVTMHGDGYRLVKG